MSWRAIAQSPDLSWPSGYATCNNQHCRELSLSAEGSVGSTLSGNRHSDSNEFAGGLFETVTPIRRWLCISCLALQSVNAALKNLLDLDKGALISIHEMMSLSLSHSLSLSFSLFLPMGNYDRYDQFIGWLSKWQQSWGGEEMPFIAGEKARENCQSISHIFIAK